MHLNPVRAGLLKADQRLLAYPWSSFSYYLAAPPHRPQWMRVDRLLGEHGLQQDSPEARLEFERRTEARRLESCDQERLKSLRRGWCLGSHQFKLQKLQELDGHVGQHHFGQLRLELAQAKAERIISEELSLLALDPRLSTARLPLLLFKPHRSARFVVYQVPFRRSTFGARRLADLMLPLLP